MVSQNSYRSRLNEDDRDKLDEVIEHADPKYYADNYVYEEAKRNPLPWQNAIFALARGVLGVDYFEVLFESLRQKPQPPETAGQEEAIDWIIEEWVESHFGERDIYDADSSRIYECKMDGADQGVLYNEFLAALHRVRMADFSSSGGHWEHATDIAWASFHDEAPQLARRAGGILEVIKTRSPFQIMCIHILCALDLTHQGGDFPLSQTMLVDSLNAMAEGSDATFKGTRIDQGTVSMWIKNWIKRGIVAKTASHTFNLQSKKGRAARYRLIYP